MYPEVAVLTRACRHAIEYLDGLNSRPVATTTGLAELRRRLNVELGASGTPGQFGVAEWHIEQRPMMTSRTAVKCASAI